MFSLGKNIKNIFFGAKCAFVHIPKTGGTYIRQFESDKNAVIKPMISIGHAYIKEDLNKQNPFRYGIIESVDYKEVKKYCIFTVVRNIYSWLVSYYNHSGGHTGVYVDKNHYDYKNSQKGFDYLLKTIINRNDIWPSRKFIFFQIFSNIGNVIVDRILKQESLDDSLKKMAKDEKLVYVKKEKQRIGFAVDYRTFYNSSLINLVEKTWKRELDLFGYDFDGFTNQKAYFANEVITKEKKKNINYSIYSDILTFKNFIKK